MEDRRFQRLNILKINQQSFHTFPDWAHSTAWNVYVGQMSGAPEQLDNGDQNLHRQAWAPLILVGSDPVNSIGLNPRAARYFARILLEAADRAEEKEIEMGWHPSQELAMVEKIQNT